MEQGVNLIETTSICLILIMELPVHSIGLLSAKWRDLKQSMRHNEVVQTPRIRRICVIYAFVVFEEDA